MTSASEPRRPARGFTLMESLIGLSIIALLATGVIGSVSWTMARTASRTDQAWAMELARSIGEEYRATGDTALLSGTGGPYQWRIETRMQGEPGALQVTVARFTVTVRRAGQADAATLDFAGGRAP